ncbi:MAG: ligand-binding sensor domain-containing protein [Candidatus Promineifilaceae bacterium]
MNELVARIDRKLIIVLGICSLICLGIGGYLLWLDTNPGASADDGTNDTKENYLADALSEITWEHYTIDAVSITRIAAAADDEFLIGADGATLASFDPTDNMLSNLHTEGRTNILQAIHHDGDEIWGGYLYTGLTYFDGVQWSNINADNGLQSSSVSAIHRTEDGQLWVGHGAYGLGMSGGGLSYQINGEWQTVEEFEGISSTNVSDISIDDEGNIWVAVTDYTSYLGPQSGGLLMFDGSEWHSFGAAEGLISSDVRAMTITESGDVWITTTAGVSMYRKGLWFHYSTDDGLASNFVVDIESDGQGRVWAATYTGVSVFDGVSWGTLTQAEGLQGDMVNALAADDSGGMLIATNGGVSRITVNLEMPQPTSIIFSQYLPIITTK